MLPILQHEMAALSRVRTRRNRLQTRSGEAVSQERPSVDRATVLRVLDELLAAEIACVCRYRRHHDACRLLAGDTAAQCIAAEYLKQVTVEQAHADRLAGRIVQLGGEPNLDPRELSTPHHLHSLESRDVVLMLRIDLVAACISIDTHVELIHWLGESDAPTKRILAEILAAEEAQAHHFVELLIGHGS